MKQTKRKQSRTKFRARRRSNHLAFFLTTLFGFAAFAVDMGFRYTRSRMLQAVADAAVSAGMPALVAGNSNHRRDNATNMAMANGYSGANRPTIDTATAGQLSVIVTATAPSFFSAIFGGGTTHLLSATAVGALTSTPGPALLTLGGCGSSGLSWSGNGAFQIKGPVESNGPMSFSTGGGLTQNFTSLVESACAVPSMGSGPITYSGGPPMQATPPANPYSSVTLASLEPYCTHGHTYAAQDLQTTDYGPVDINGIATLTPGVYCSSGNMNLSGPGTAFIATGVTIIAGGAVTVGANNTLAGSSSHHGRGRYSQGARCLFRRHHRQLRRPGDQPRKHEPHGKWVDLRSQWMCQTERQSGNDGEWIGNCAGHGHRRQWQTGRSIRAAVSAASTGGCCGSPAHNVLISAGVE